jgi:tetratricopeptide (TPR) repeat protein
MKKFVLIAAGLMLVVAAFAQKSKIQSAKNYLADQSFEKAKAAIEEAVNDESTKDDPKAWYVRGTVYLALQALPENEGKELYSEAAKSFKKAVALQPDYEKEDLNKKLFAVSIYRYLQFGKQQALHWQKLDKI